MATFETSAENNTKHIWFVPNGHIDELSRAWSSAADAHEADRDNHYSVSDLMFEAWNEGVRLYYTITEKI